jgi:hypothetical protein
MYVNMSIDGKEYRVRVEDIHNILYPNSDINACNLNITHNLTKMASKAGLYEPLWRPYRLFGVTDKDEYNCTILAEDLIEPIEVGYKRLISEPEYFKKFSSPNGWGIYEHFVPFVEKVLTCYKTYPKAEIEVWR